MDSRTRFFLWAVPLAGMLVLVAALTSRRGPGVPAESKATPRTPSAPAAALVSASAAPRPQAAPEKTVAAESEVARVRSTYQNYRTAVATGNTTLAKAILPVLTKDRGVAVRLAEEDLAQAPSDFDRTVARKVLEGLR